MGASFNSMVLDGSLAKPAVIAAFTEAQERDRYENGDEYSGGFGMVRGLQFHDTSHVTVRSAVVYLEDTARKWEPALAVRANKDGAEVWVIGAWCAE